MDFEVMVAAGSVKGHTRKMVVVGCYLPPGYAPGQGEEALQHISDVLVHVKQRFTDPYIIVTGDFNQWAVEDTLLDFPDIREAPVGATRNGRAIDRIFTNMSRSVGVAGVLAPLETEEGDKKSDHGVAYCSIEIPKLRSFEWQTFTY